jgi:hypothetical protein
VRAAQQRERRRKTRGGAASPRGKERNRTRKIEGKGKTRGGKKQSKNLFFLDYGGTGRETRNPLDHGVVRVFFSFLSILLMLFCFVLF